MNISGENTNVMTYGKHSKLPGTSSRTHSEKQNANSIAIKFRTAEMIPVNYFK